MPYGHLLHAYLLQQKKTEDPSPLVINVPDHGTAITQKYGKAVIHLHFFVGEDELEDYDDNVVRGEEEFP